MIRSEQEYQEACKRLEQDAAVARQQHAALVELGLTTEEVERAMEPLYSFQAQLAEEVRWYEEVLRRNFAPLTKLTHIGRLLIALRLANGVT